MYSEFFSCTNEAVTISLCLLCAITSEIQSDMWEVKILLV